MPPIGWHFTSRQPPSDEGIGPGYEGVGEFYDLFASNADIPFYLQYAKKQGSPVLDVGAGAGRVTLALAREGFEVTALEQSPSMLGEMRRRVRSLPREIAQRVSIIEGDMTDFSIGCRFRLIIIPGSFGHAMTTQKQLSVLTCIRKHLTSNGLFILDLHVGALLPEEMKFEELPSSLPDGRRVVRSGVIHTDMVLQIMKVDLQYTVSRALGEGDQDKQVIEVISGAAVIFNREADLLVKMAGFVVEQELGGFDGRPYTPECDRRILLLKRG